jgi:hypothetical protein
MARKLKGITQKGELWLSSFVEFGRAVCLVVVARESYDGLLAMGLHVMAKSLSTTHPGLESKPPCQFEDSLATSFVCNIRRLPQGFFADLVLRQLLTPRLY